MRKLKQVQWSRIEREQVALEEEKVYVTSGKKKASVRKESSAISGMRVTTVHQNRHQKPLHLNDMRWKYVEKKKRQRQKSDWQSSSTTVQILLKGTCTRSPCEYWHPAECQFDETKSGCKFGAECSFPHWNVEDNQQKAERMKTKVQLLL